LALESGHFFLNYCRLGLSGGMASSLGASADTLKLSLAHAPRSMFLHRSQQNGRKGLSAE
jgi:hypothetical protein